MDSLNILITGASGFIGTHLIRSLREQSHTIFALDIVPPREKHPDVTYLQHDIRTLSELVLPVTIDRIYNFAAIHTTPGHEDIEYFDTNIHGAIEVVQLAKQHKTKEIIFTSSISVYGPNEESLNETSQLTPNSAYGYSKAQAEKIHLAWARDANAHCLTIVRPAVVFGEGEGGNFTRLAKVLRRGVFPFPGRTDTIKACIYVKELVMAIDYIHSQNQSVAIFNGAFNQKYTIEQIVDTFRQVSFPKVKKVLIPEAILMGSAKVIACFKGLGLGINPERITKLVRSTNIEPSHLTQSGYQYQYDLSAALEDWSSDTAGEYK
ncbi:NAD-dependent epimerase/dehydratase family protein [Vibrio sp. FNV 38]|nr:NAD-dependent epimerase/dehydratase family protein [Vibrio sp. FNV 38]